MVFLYLGVYIFLIFYSIFVLPRHINEKMDERIKKEGLYHITRRDLVPLIVDANGIAHFRPSNRWNSWSNLFRESVFFFVGKPTRFRYILNIIDPLKPFKKKDLVVLHVKGEDIDDNIIKKLRWRPVDKTIMHLGELTIPVEIQELTF